MYSYVAIQYGMSTHTDTPTERFSMAARSCSRFTHLLDQLLRHVLKNLVAAFEEQRLQIVRLFVQLINRLLNVF